MTSPNLADEDFESVPIDPAHPLKGIIVCCTSIPPDQRTSIASKVSELGGLHKYDLTPDVTHLVVGDYDTPKYRHVARERSDIKAMDASWIEAMSELWKKDDDIDFPALEAEHQLKPFEKRGIDPSASGQPAARDSLLICLTGFGDQRDDIARRVTENGGQYTGDLTRRCTHLVVSKPEGKKFAAAKAWSIHTVTLEWLDQSIARGMILEETKFDPILPPEEQGKGAWVKRDPRRAASWGKRSRSAMTGGTEDGPRKLRKTASMKLNSQKNNLWGDILGRSTSREYSFAGEQDKQLSESRDEQQPQQEPQPQRKPELIIPAHQEQQGVFAYCYFFIHGFTPQRTDILDQTIRTLGGNVCSFLYEAALGPYPQTGDPRGRFLLVPQSSQPATHPPENYDNLYVVTEYYIERCLHNKAFLDPNEQVLGRPFPLFPIPGFTDLTVCSAAFTGIELHQVSRSVIQLGACFQEEFRRNTSVLVCKSLAATRKEKLRMALKWGVPAVSADWLWECISTGFKAPVDDFIFPELKGHYEAAKRQQGNEPRSESKPKQLAANAEPRALGKSIQRTRSEPALRRAASKPPAKVGIDTSGFDDDTPKPQPRLTKPSAKGGVDTSAFDDDMSKPQPRPTKPNPVVSHETAVSADFATALTHHPPESFPAEVADSEEAPPLSEASSNRLNKSPSPVKQTTGLPRTHSDPTKSVTTRPSPPVEDTAATKRKLQQAAAALEQEARNKAKAAERQALSSKLTSLIAPIGSNASDDTSDPSNPVPVGPRPRRRQILGRAISNASNASSDAARSDILLREHIEQSLEDQPPPATQLEYADPRAQECKAALMSRMMGGGGEVKPKAVNSTPSGVGRSMRRR